MCLGISTVALQVKKKAGHAYHKLGLSPISSQHYLHFFPILWNLPVFLFIDTNNSSITEGKYIVLQIRQGTKPHDTQPCGTWNNSSWSTITFYTLPMSHHREAVQGQAILNRGNLESQIECFQSYSILFHPVLLGICSYAVFRVVKHTQV